MARKKKEWWSRDVYWYAGNRKRPIAYSTTASSDFISIMNEPNTTPTKLLEKIRTETTGCFESEAVLEEYIEMGFGDEILKTRCFI